MLRPNNKVEVCCPLIPIGMEIGTCVGCVYYRGISMRCGVFVQCACPIGALATAGDRPG